MLRAKEEPRPSAAEQRDDFLLWLALLLGPFAMAVNTVVGYTVAHWVNDVAQKRMSYLVSAIDFVLCLCAFALAFTLRGRYAQASEEAPQSGRRHFMATMGILLSVLSMLLVIAGTLAVITLRPSD